MKQLVILLLLAAPCSSFAQFGIKAGPNFANVTGASSINNSARTGFHAGILLAPASKGILGSRTELIFSRQGYNFKTGTNTGAVDLNYIMLPQYLTINITKYVQLQLGAQMAYLLNAKVDSSQQSGAGAYGALLKYYNRFDYGYGGGVEIHPFKGLLLGARINISLGNLYRDPSTYTSPGQPSSFMPRVDVKNNVFQFFAGWRFGRQ